MVGEEQFVFLIYILYLIRFIKVVNKSNLLLTYNYKKVIVSFPLDFFNIDGQKVIYLNPFKFFIPSYNIDKNKVGNQNIKLLKRTKLYSQKLCKILPIVVTLWIILLIFLPISLYFVYQLYIIYLIALIYAIISILCIVIWIYRKEFRVSKKVYFSLLFDYFLCPPFAINAMRDLSFSYLKEIK